MNISDCEFIRECELHAQRFKNQVASNQLESKQQINRDPCLPDAPPPESDVLRYQFKPLPRHYLRNPQLPTYPPVDKFQDITVNDYFYYPRPVQPVILAKPNNYHYRPTNIFNGLSTYTYSYQPHVVWENLRPEPIAFLEPNLYQKKREPVIPSKPCETTTKFYFYKKEIKPRDRTRAWYQKKRPYATPMIQVESETSTGAAYQVPPYSKPIRQKIPRGNIFFGDYRLRS